MKSTTDRNFEAEKRFIGFVFLIIAGGVLSYLTLRRGMNLTSELFRDTILSLDLLGPVIYFSIFIIRPLFLIPSIMLFIAGGLAFGPLWGPLYASLGAVLGGSLGFWIARNMGHDFVMRKLKLGKGAIQKTSFNFYIVFFLSFLPVMPVTAINYGAGLSRMSFKDYIVAHALGITPRAFAYGYFGSALLEIGSPKFKAAVLILIAMGFLTLCLRQYISKKNAVKTNSSHLDQELAITSLKIT
jgi:uncharacterized membrane protein YdjX (TVP38/TMEM64 family)